MPNLTTPVEIASTSGSSSISEPKKFASLPSPLSSPGLNTPTKITSVRGRSKFFPSQSLSNQESTGRPITPLHAIPYVHGSYASASPHFLTNPKFASILKRLLPPAYDELRSLTSTANRRSNGQYVHPDPVKVMKWAENNPVVSAFGIWESDSGRRTVCIPPNKNLLNEEEEDWMGNSVAENAKASFRRRRRRARADDKEDQKQVFEIRPSHSKPALEWDVFLDPKLVRQVCVALEVVDDLEGKMGRLRRSRKGRANVANDEDDDEEFDLFQAHTAALIEVDRLVSQLMKRMILAHGSMSQLVLEAMGIGKDYNYKSVVKGTRDNGEGHKRRGKDTPTLPVWDKDEEQRDFEALLNPNHFIEQKDNNTPKDKKKKPTSFVGSRGIFMENWLSIFSQTLVLLKNNSDPEKARSDTLPYSRRRRSGNNIRLESQSVPPAQIGNPGLGGFLRSMLFTRKNSSFVMPTPTAAAVENRSFDEDFQEVDSSEEEVDYDTSDCASENGIHMPSLLDISPRSHDSDAYDDMFSSRQNNTSSFGAMCGVSLCFLGDETPASSPHDLHYASHNMSRDIQRISEVLGEPLRLVLDLKSRRVPPKVWSRLIDALRSRGLVVEGIGSFDMDELRTIAKSCSCPLTPILFFHSIGDLQRACHANEVKKGDTVYFNGGSLMWKPSTLMEAAERNCCGCIETTDLDNDFDVMSDISMNKPDPPTKQRSDGKGSYSFQPYAYPRASLSDWERVMCKSTLECYARHFNLKVGVYVQEFSISPEAIDALSSFVNAHGALYDQGLAFGGINGLAAKHIHGDGYWNQRYVGRSWDFNARPSNDMMPLKPEDHHMVQKAIQAGAWAQVAGTYEVTDEQAGALTLKKREPCDLLQPGLGF